jgi:LysR family transcriptional regulator for metE and metH
MDLEVRHLKLVRAVAAFGGLTRAGRELHLTQSALSHQLRDVETRLGTPIFLRVGKRMVLTSAGERLLRSADEILGTLERTEDAIRLLAGGRGGRLRVSTGVYTQYHWLPFVVRRFRTACPQVDVQIVAGAGRDVVDLLVDGSIDLGIVDRPVEDARLVARQLFDDELVAVVEPAHRLASKRFAEPEDFEDETLLLDAPVESHAVYQQFFAPAGVRLASILLADQTSAMLELVRAGLGVAILARWAVQPLVRRGILQTVRLAPAGQLRHWNALVLKELGATTYVTEFLGVFSRALSCMHEAQMQNRHRNDESI